MPDYRAIITHKDGSVTTHRLRADKDEFWALKVAMIQPATIDGDIINAEIDDIEGPGLPKVASEILLDIIDRPGLKGRPTGQRRAEMARQIAAERAKHGL